MPVTELPAGAKLDSGTAPSRGVVELPHDVPLDGEGHTTASGLAAAAGRGLAPYAAGAAVGAAAGAPFGGVGAIPGAIAGAGAVGLTELATGGYNAIASLLGSKSRVTTPTEATGQLLDVAGIKRPSTTAERLTETATGDVAAFAAPGAAIRTGERALTAGKPVGDAMRQQYFRAVRPSSAGIESASDLQRYTDNVTQAVRRIIEVDGDKLPKSVEDFSKAIGRAKTATYGEYHPMAEAAEKAGVRIDAMPAIERMRQLAADPLADPSARAAAKRLLRSVPESGRVLVTPSQAEKFIADFNQRSGDFSTTAKGAATAFREAARELREQLIGSVEGAGFPQYGALRRTYGALQEVEPDVAKATVVGLRQGNGIGLTEGIAAGVSAAGHPGIGTGIEATKLLSRFFGSPDRAVQRLFQQSAAGGGGRVADLARGVGASAVPLGAGGSGSFDALTGPDTMATLARQAQDNRERIAAIRQAALVP